MRAHFVADQSAGPEALHYAAAAARWLEGRGWTVSVETGGDAELARLFAPLAASTSSGGRRVVFSSHPAAAAEPEFRVAVHGSTLRMTGGGAAVDLPLALSPITFSFPAKPSLDVPRVLLRGDTTLSRRLRMSSKVIVELRRRGWPFELAAYGDVPDELMRASPPDEIHHAVSVIELTRLVGTVSAILETADRELELSPAFAIGSSLGLPTFLHRDAAPAVAGPACLMVEEWSGDAFADAVTSADLRSTFPGDDRRLQESFERFEKVLLGT